VYRRKHWRDCHCNFKWPTIFILEHVRIRFTTVPLNLCLSDENDEDILVFISEECFFFWKCHAQKSEIHYLLKKPQLKIICLETKNHEYPLNEGWLEITLTVPLNEGWLERISLSYFIRTHHSWNGGWLEITLTVPLNARKSYLCSTTDTDNCFPFRVLHIHPRLNITG